MLRKLSIALIWIGGLATGIGFIARVGLHLDPHSASVLPSAAFVVFLVGMVLFVLDNLFLRR
ncbi:MAG: hypothetical protein QJR06_00805 [Alicyclobacillaceae bacterium]|nr:hypothetical protein [Alicyclobacillaceae bacterium]